MFTSVALTLDKENREKSTRLLLNDAFLMMYQTEWVETDTAVYEIDARFCASVQTSPNRVPTLKKTKNGLKPRFQAIFPWQGHKDSDPGHAVLERMWERH